MRNGKNVIVGNFITPPSQKTPVNLTILSLIYLSCRFRVFPSWYRKSCQSCPPNCSHHRCCSLRWRLTGVNMGVFYSRITRRQDFSCLWLSLHAFLKVKIQSVPYKKLELCTTSNCLPRFPKCAKLASRLVSGNGSRFHEKMVRFFPDEMVRTARKWLGEKEPLECGRSQIRIKHYSQLILRRERWCKSILRCRKVLTFALLLC